MIGQYFATSPALTASDEQLHITAAEAATYITCLIQTLNLKVKRPSKASQHVPGPACPQASVPRTITSGGAYACQGFACCKGLPAFDFFEPPSLQQKELTLLQTGVASGLCSSLFKGNLQKSSARAPALHQQLVCYQQRCLLCSQLVIRTQPGCLSCHW